MCLYFPVLVDVETTHRTEAGRTDKESIVDEFGQLFHDKATSSHRS